MMGYYKYRRVRPLLAVIELKRIECACLLRLFGVCWYMVWHGLTVPFAIYNNILIVLPCIHRRLRCLVVVVVIVVWLLLFVYKTGPPIRVG